MEDNSSSAKLPLSGGSYQRKIITPARVVFAYAVLASLWILGSGFVSTVLVVDPVFRSYVELGKGLLFVATTSALLYVLLRAWRDPEERTITEFAAVVRDKSAAISIVGALGVVMLPLLSGYAVYRYHQTESRDGAFVELAAVAQLKTGQIERWLEERMGDGLVLSSNSEFIAAVGRLAASGDDRRAREFLIAGLNTLWAAYGYESIMILDSEGKPIETLGDHVEVPDDLRGLVRESISTRRVLRRDLTLDVSGDVHIDWIVPMVSPTNSTSNVAVLRMSADHFLYPTIQTWPTRSETAETVLVSRSGDSVLYLNPPRGQDSKPLSMTRPLADETLTASIAIRSQAAGETTGLDYRNRPVVAVYRPVNGTNWYLIAKIEESEVFTPLYPLAVLVGAVTFFSIIGLLFVGILFWRELRVGQRLEVELQRRNSDRLQQMFFDLPFVGMAAISPDGRLLQFNDYFCVILGYPRELMATKSWIEVTSPPEILPTGEELDEIGGLAGTNSPGMKRILRGDGVAIDASIDIRPIFKENGQTDYLTAMIQDVSARRRMERALRQSEEFATSVFNSITAHLAVLDRDGTIIAVNDPWKKFAAENDGSELVEGSVGVNYLDVCASVQDPSDIATATSARDGILSILAGVSRNFSVEYPCDAPDRKRWFVMMVNAMLGEPRRVVVGHIDITERKNAERALADERNRLREVIWGTNAGTWEWNVQTGEVVFSERWAEMVGYTLQELSPVSIRTWEQLVHPEDLKKSDELLEKVFAHDLDHYECDVRMRHKNGNWIWVADRGNVVVWGLDGKPLRMSGTHTDITRQKNAEEKIIRIAEFRSLVVRCQSLMLTEKDEEKLFQGIARILVDTRGYELVWFGVPQHNLDRDIAKIAGAGRALPYLDELTIRWSDDDFSHGPTGSAVKTGEIHVLRHMAAANMPDQWHDAAMQAGVKTSAAVPLIDRGNVFAVLSVYSSIDDVFDQEEVDLLSELATNISVHIQALRIELERDKIRDALGRASSGAINAIAATIEKRDPYTSGHQHRVAEMSVAIARELGWPESRIEGLRLGATIHDIGKIYVPAEILNRPGKLSASEFAIIKSHPQVGADILEHVDFPWPIREMVLQHHERIDGTGYPNGLRGEKIADEAKVIAVADVVEAITSHRPYRPGLGLDKALAEIEAGRGTAYDPAIADTCLSLFRDKGYKVPQ